MFAVSTRCPLCPAIKCLPPLTVIIHILLGLLLTSTVAAQSSDPYTGSPAFVTSVKGQFDSINLPYGTVLVEFPVRSKAGKYPLTFSLVGNSDLHINPPSVSNY